MKVTMNEYESCFSINLEAETMEDASVLVRFGMNGTKELIHKGANSYKDGTFYGSVTIGKRKRTVTGIAGK